MTTGCRLSVLARFVLMLALGLAPISISAQGQREIDLIAELGQEQIAARQAAAAAKAELEHQRQLEEQSRLRAIFKEYLGDARRAAQRAIAKKRNKASAEEVAALRRQARIIIDEVTDPTKKRIPESLNPIYEKLEKLIAVTSDELIESDPELGQLRKKLSRGNDLDWVDQAAILYALCPDKDQAEVIANNIPFREQLSDDEAKSIDDCNRRRLILGLNPLAIDMKLVECSRDHSSDMVSEGFFSHTSPVPGKTTPWDRAKNFGTSASGENIAAGYGSGLAVNNGWWHSPGHLKNMMGRGHKRIAVGQKNQTYTQMFGR